MEASRIRQLASNKLTSHKTLGRITYLIKIYYKIIIFKQIIIFEKILQFINTCIIEQQIISILQQLSNYKKCKNVLKPF